KKKIVRLGLGFFYFTAYVPRMNGWPAKYCFYQPLLTVDQYPFCRSDLVIHSAVPFQVYKPMLIDIIHKPAYLIGMCFDHNFEIGARINHAYCSSVRIGEGAADKWLKVI